MINYPQSPIQVDTKRVRAEVVGHSFPATLITLYPRPGSIFFDNFAFDEIQQDYAESLLQYVDTALVGAEHTFGITLLAGINSENEFVNIPGFLSTMIAAEYSECFEKLLIWSYFAGCFVCSYSMDNSPPVMGSLARLSPKGGGDKYDQAAYLRSEENRERNRQIWNEIEQGKR